MGLDGQNVQTEKIYSGKFEDLSLPDALNYLQLVTGFQFAYSSSLIASNTKISYHFNGSLKELLNGFCEKTGFGYTVFGSQVLLKKEPAKSRLILKGKILESDSLLPLAYASISIKNFSSGSIGDINGNFELELEDKNFYDTLVFSSMGYGHIVLPVKDFIDRKSKTIILKPISYELPPAKVSSKDFKKVIMGNRKNIPNGSLYLDTHGQQAALEIENKENINGKILALNYYLSPKGNTEAPFRVRLYLKDSVTGGPGKDLLPEILVVKPDVKKGWFAVNVSEYHIEVPSEGFFIAMEGIYPNDYNFYAGDNEFVELSPGDEVEVEEPDLATITYGQRLGFTRNKKDKNNTWHYSLSHTWFQLKKQPFGLMASADIQMKKERNKKREK